MEGVERRGEKNNKRRAEEKNRGVEWERGHGRRKEDKGMWKREIWEANKRGGGQW